MGLIRKAAEPKSDQLNAVDLIGDVKIMIKIVSVSVDLSKEQRVTVQAQYLNGEKIRPFKPCKNMQNCMIQGWGDEENTYAGKYLELFRDPKAIYAGQEVGGIRISGMSNIKHDFTFMYRKNRTSFEPMNIRRIDPSEYTTAQPKPIDPAVKAAGDAAAAGGVKSYTDWKDSLAPDVKETIKPYHLDWVKVAKEADQPKEQQTATEAPPI